MLILNFPHLNTFKNKYFLMKKIVFLLAGLALSPYMQAQVADNCSDATPLALSSGVSQTVTGTTVGATDDGTEGAPMVWIAFTTPGGTCNYSVAVDYCNSPTELYYTGNLGDMCGPLATYQSPTESVACASSLNYTQTFSGLAPNTTYYLPIVGYYDDGMGIINEDGPFQISLLATTSCAPPNDACGSTSPTTLNNGGTAVFMGTTTGATMSADEDAPTVWEAITLPVIDPGCTYDIDISYCGTPTTQLIYYTILLDDCVEGTGYTGDFSTETFCNDDNSVVSFSGIPPGTYYIPILGAYDDGMGNVNAAGSYSISVSATSSCGSSNDLCSNVTPINLTTGTTQTVSGTTVGATMNIGEDYPFVWEAFTTPSGSNCTYSVNVSYCNSATALTLYGNLANSCGVDALFLAPGPMQPCTSGANSSMVFSGLAPGTTYYLPVLGYYDDGVNFNPEGSYSIDLTLEETCAPPNDICADVSPVTLQANVPQTFTGSTVGAQLNGNETGAEVWEAFTIPGNASNCTYTVELSLCGTDPVPLFYENLYTSCDMIDYLEGVLTSCADGNYILTFENVLPGTYYYPVVGAFQGNPEGPYTMTVTASALVPPAPTVTASGSTEFCEGGSVTLTSSATSGNIWSTGATTSSITVSQSGSYTVSVSTTGCPSASSDPVEVSVIPAATVDAINVTQGDDGYVSATAVNPQNVSTYIWNFGDATGDNPGTNPQDHTYTVNGNYIVTLTVGNECGDNTTNLTIVVESVPPTGITDLDLEAQQLRIFPNPGSGVLQLENKSRLHIRSLTVYDLSGKVLFQRNVQDNGHYNLDLSHLSSGSYLLKIDTDHGALNRKFEIIR